MSRNGYAPPQFWGDASYSFRLGMGELDELEEETKVGIGVIWGRLQPVALNPFGAQSTREVRLVLRLGLVGGGMDKERAAALVERHYQPGDLDRGAKIAFAALTAALIGCDDDPAPKPGEADGEATSAHGSPTAAPTGAPSTATAPS